MKTNDFCQKLIIIKNWSKKMHSFLYSPKLLALTGSIAVQVRTASGQQSSIWSNCFRDGGEML